MPFVIPEDPFTRNMGQAITSGAEYGANALKKLGDDEKNYNTNYDYARSKGIPEEQARAFAKLSPQQVSEEVHNYAQEQGSANAAEFSIASLDLDNINPAAAEAMRNAKTTNEVMQMSNFIREQNKDNTEMKINQQIRLKKDSMNTDYNRAVKDIKDGISGGMIRDEKSANKSIQKLRKEQARNKANISKGKAEEDIAFQEYIDVFSEKPNISDEKLVRKKIKFDPNNKEHISLRDKILKESNGDKKATNKRLSEIFN
jgi:hypothetical protein